MVEPKKIQRYCQTLELKDDPELIEKYKHFHSKEGFWPEIGDFLKEAGVEAMEIYIYHTRLFMIMDVNQEFSPEKMKELKKKHPKDEEWQKLMLNFQKLLPESTEEQKWIPMEKIFDLTVTKPKPQVKTEKMTSGSTLKKNWNEYDSESEEVDEQENHSGSQENNQDQDSENEKVNEGIDPAYINPQRKYNEGDNYYENRRSNGGQERYRERRPEYKDEPKEELINNINQSESEANFINLWNVDRKLSPQDIKNVFSPFWKIEAVSQRNKQGIFHLQFFSKKDAIEFINMEKKKMGDREYYIRTSHYKSRAKNYSKYGEDKGKWNNDNKEYNNKPYHRKEGGGYYKKDGGNYNRSEGGSYSKYEGGGYSKYEGGSSYTKNEGGSHRRNDGDGYKNEGSYTKDYKKPRQRDDDFSRNNGEFIKRSNILSKKIDDNPLPPLEQVQSLEEPSKFVAAKIDKPNPWGAAKPRDESKFVTEDGKLLKARQEQEEEAQRLKKEQEKIKQEEERIRLEQEAIKVEKERVLLEQEKARLEKENKAKADAKTIREEKAPKILSREKRTEPVQDSQQENQVPREKEVNTHQTPTRIEDQKEEQAIERKGRGQFTATSEDNQTLEHDKIFTAEVSKKPSQESYHYKDGRDYYYNAPRGGPYNQSRKDFYYEKPRKTNYNTHYDKKSHNQDYEDYEYENEEYHYKNRYNNDYNYSDKYRGKNNNYNRYNNENKDKEIKRQEEEDLKPEKKKDRETDSIISEENLSKNDLRHKIKPHDEYTGNNKGENIKNFNISTAPKTFESQETKESNVIKTKSKEDDNNFEYENSKRTYQGGPKYQNDYYYYDKGYSQGYKKPRENFSRGDSYNEGYKKMDFKNNASYQEYDEGTSASYYDRRNQGSGYSYRDKGSQKYQTSSNSYPSKYSEGNYKTYREKNSGVSSEYGFKEKRRNNEGEIGYSKDQNYKRDKPKKENDEQKPVDEFTQVKGGPDPNKEQKQVNSTYTKSNKKNDKSSTNIYEVLNINK